MSNKWVAVAGALGLAGGALATPTSLIMLPIADILGHREVAFNVTASGMQKSVDPKTYWASGITIGLFDRLEIGADTDFEGGSITDFKILLAENAKQGWALSAGACNISQKERTIDKFVFGRKDFKGFRLHAGYMYSDTHRAVVGADFELPNGYSGAIEHFGGTNSITWFAVNAPLKVLKQELTLTLAAGVPSVKADGNQWMASVGYGFRF